MLLPAKIFLFWQVVAFQNIEIILDMIQGRELRFKFFQSGIIGFFLCLQGVILSRKLLQRWHLSLNRGIRYELEDRKVSWQVDGAPCRVRIDNGNAWSTLPFDAKEMPLHNGHILLILQAGHEKGEAHLQLNVEGFEERTLTFIFR